VPSQPRDTTRSTIQKRDEKGVIRHGAEWLAIWSDPESMKDRAEQLRDSVARRTSLEKEKNVAAAARSMAGDSSFSVALKERGPALRGEADSAALWKRFHDERIPASQAPLFHLCERVRCEALGAALFPGVRENVVARQRARVEKEDLLNAHLALLVPVAEALEMVLRDALTGATEPSIPSSGFWMWDRWIRERFSADFEAMRSSVKDQAAFGRLAAAFLGRLTDEIGQDEVLKPPARQRGGEERFREDRDQEECVDSALRPDAEGLAQVHEQRIVAEPRRTAPVAYRAFTTAHDRVAHAGNLVGAARLRELREAIEKRRGDFRRQLARLTARFERRLLAKQKREWTFDLDEGLIDAARLDRVIVNPGFASAYKQERDSLFRDTVVSILIDNSGSMRGKPIEIAYLAAELISAALDRCGVGCEILGFTTTEWKGGESAKDWVRAGRPADPGRLNDLLHIVYKSASEPARRARASIAAMLEPTLLKENIDGEALRWASRRLIARPECRKVLIVISDGAPVDQTTIENNSDKQILDRHLRQVIREIESSGAIELTAIGVKHEAGEYYRNSIHIDDPGKLGAGLIELVDRALTRD
jgi:cobaltochelatase CobT